MNKDIKSLLYRSPLKIILSIWWLIQGCLILARSIYDSSRHDIWGILLILGVIGMLFRNEKWKYYALSFIIAYVIDNVLSILVDLLLVESIPKYIKNSSNLMFLIITILNIFVIIFEHYQYKSEHN